MGHQTNPYHWLPASHSFHTLTSVQEWIKTHITFALLCLHQMMSFGNHTRGGRRNYWPDEPLSSSQVGLWFIGFIRYKCCIVLLHPFRIKVWNIFTYRGLRVTYRRGLDWIYWHFIHSTLNYRQLQRCSWSTHFTVHRSTHALRFSVFTSPILATDLQQSHCHFKSHMKSSFHSQIPLLPVFCNFQFRRLDSIQLLCSQVHILTGWRLETPLDYYFLNESSL
jgi:hypothetical protein